MFSFINFISYSAYGSHKCTETQLASVRFVIQSCTHWRIQVWADWAAVPHGPNTGFLLFKY